MAGLAGARGPPGTFRPPLQLSNISGSFLRALSESRFFAQRKMVESRSSPEIMESMRPFT